MKKENHIGLLGRNKVVSRAKRGFTLIEIVVVIAVIGLLAALVIPRFSSIGTAATTNTRATQIKRVNDLLETYQAAGGTFGATYSAGTAGGTNGVIRTDTVANLITDLQAGAYGSGILFQLPAGTVTWPNGTTPTIASNRLQ